MSAEAMHLNEPVDDAGNPIKGGSGAVSPMSLWVLEACYQALDSHAKGLRHIAYAGDCYTLEGWIRVLS